MASQKKENREVKIKTQYQPKKTIIFDANDKPVSLRIEGNDILHELSLVKDEHDFMKLLGKCEKKLKKDLKNLNKIESPEGVICESNPINAFLSDLEVWKFHLPKDDHKSRMKAILLSIFAFKMGIYSVFSLHDYPYAERGKASTLGGARGQKTIKAKSGDKPYEMKERKLLVEKMFSEIRKDNQDLDSRKIIKTIASELRVHTKTIKRDLGIIK